MQSIKNGWSCTIQISIVVTFYSIDPTWKSSLLLRHPKNIFNSFYSNVSKKCKIFCPKVNICLTLPFIRRLLNWRNLYGVGWWIKIPRDIKYICPRLNILIMRDIIMFKGQLKAILKGTVAVISSVSPFSIFDSQMYTYTIIWVMLGTFPSDNFPMVFSQVATSQLCNLPNGSFPSLP